MEKLWNIYQLSIWKWRKLINRQNMIAPLVWKQAAEIQVPEETFDGLDSVNRKKLTEIRNEAQLISRLMDHFPSKISTNDWLTLLQCQTRKQRLDHLMYLKSIELLREKDRLKKIAAKEAAAARAADAIERNGEQRVMERCYMHPNVKDEYLLRGQRLARSFILPEAPTIVVDCRFLPNLSPRGRDLTALQLQYIATANRQRKDPWRMYYVNFDASNAGVARAKKKHLSLCDSWYNCSPILTADNFTQLAPLDKIVYLSPHATEEIEEIKEDEVYVIGGIVDRVPEYGIHKEASRVAAEEDGVRCAKLPLDKYVTWKSGTKYLTLIAVSNILHDAYYTNDWARTLEKNIPVRNTRSAEEKNALSREKHQRIRNFKHGVLKMVAARLGPG